MASSNFLKAKHIYSVGETHSLLFRRGFAEVLGQTTRKRFLLNPNKFHVVNRTIYQWMLLTKREVHTGKILVEFFFIASLWTEPHARSIILHQNTRSIFSQYGPNKIKKRLYYYDFIELPDSKEHLQCGRNARATICRRCAKILGQTTRKKFQLNPNKFHFEYLFKNKINACNQFVSGPS